MKTKILLLFCLICLCTNVCSQIKWERTFDNGTKAFIVSEDKKKFGVVDSNNSILLPSEFDKIECHGNLIFCTKRKNEINQTCEIYNSKGEAIITSKDGFSSYYYNITKKGKWTAILKRNDGDAIINENGEFLYKYKELKDAQGFSYLKNTIADTVVIGPGKYIKDNDNGGYSAFSIWDDYIITSIGNKRGVVNIDGSEIIPALKYRRIQSSEGGFCVSLSREGGYVGYYDRKGKCIFPAVKYTSITPLSNGTFCCIENGKACVVDSFGKVILRTKYHDLSLKKDENGKVYYNTYIGKNFNGFSIARNGVMSLSGKIEKEPELKIQTKNVITHDGFNYTEVLDINGLHGVKDSYGVMIIPCEYDYISFTTKYDKIQGFILKKNGFVGFASKDGKIIIPCSKYHNMDTIYGNGKYFCVELDGRLGFCDLNGKEIIEPLYDYLIVIKGKIYAKVGEMMGVLNENGKVQIPFEYTNVAYNEETNRYSISLFGKVGICDANGNIVIPPLYTFIGEKVESLSGPFKNLYAVYDGKTCGLYTFDGKLLFPASLYTSCYITKNNNLSFKDEWCIVAYNEDKIEYYYDLKGNLLYGGPQDNQFGLYFKQGLDEFNKKNYRKSIEYNEAALKIRKDESAYFNIGAAYYNLGKYKDAIKYLRLCVDLGRTQSLKDRATNLIIDSEERLQAKRERRTNVLLAFIGAGLNVAANVMQTNNSIQYYNSHNHSFIGNNNFTRDTSMDFLLDPRVAINRVQQENWQEYLQMTNGGKTMTYQEWQIVKGQALMEAKNGGTSSSLSSESGSTSSPSSNSTATSSGKNCTFCAGLGDCKTCGGRGYYYNPLDMSKTVLCPNCKNHNGICSHCNGTGRMK